MDRVLILVIVIVVAIAIGPVPIVWWEYEIVFRGRSTSNIILNRRIIVAQEHIDG